MKFVKYLLLCFMTACAHSAPTLRNADGEAKKICQKALTYGVKAEVALSDEALQALYYGVDYWNLLAAEPIFVIAQDGEPNIWISISPEKKTGGTTRHYYADPSNKCIIGGQVKIGIDEIKPGCFYKLQTLVRHEFGHMLGLGNVQKRKNSETCAFPDLMCEKFANEEIFHPIDANKEEIATLRLTYPEREWHDTADQWVIRCFD